MIFHHNLKIYYLFILGTDGTHCELDSLNECASKPCAHGAACQDRVGDYACYCPPKWAGKNCNNYDPNFRGGIGRANIQVFVTIIIPVKQFSYHTPGTWILSIIYSVLITVLLKILIVVSF